MFHLTSSPIVRQYLVIFTANLSILCFAIDVAWPTPVLLKIRNETQTVLSRPITDEEGSWIVSIGTLTGILFNFKMGYIMDRIGRRTCIVIGYIPRLMMCFVLLFAKEVWLVYFARGISGVANVFVMSVIPTYTSEIASKDTRGALGTITQVSSALGMMIIFGLGPFLSYTEINVLHLCIVAVVIVPTWFLPETPYYLYSKGQDEKSMKNLIHLRSSERVAKEEIKQYQLNCTNISIREMFKDWVNLKTLMKVLFVSIFQQLIGYNAVLMYMMEIIKSSQTTVKEEFSSVVIGCIQLAACFCTMLIAEKLGRKTILVTTFIGMALGMVGLGIFFHLKQEHYEICGFLNIMPLLSMMLSIFCFNAGPGSIFGTLIAELFDSPARATGVSISIGTTVIFIFLTTKYFVCLIKTFGPAIVYYFFSCNCIIIAIFISYCIPETKGKTFGEIQMELGRKAMANSSISLEN